VGSEMCIRDRTIFETTEWYKKYFEKKDMRDVTMNQIQKYMKKMKNNSR